MNGQHEDREYQLGIGVTRENGGGKGVEK